MTRQVDRRDPEVQGALSALKRALQLYPTNAVALTKYAATLAQWFGVTGDALNTVFPNLSRFAHPDLGFMQS